MTDTHGKLTIEWGIRDDTGAPLGSLRQTTVDAEALRNCFEDLSPTEISDDEIRSVLNGYVSDEFYDKIGPVVQPDDMTGYVAAARKLLEATQLPDP